MGYIPAHPPRYISLAPMGSRETNPFGQRASLKPLLCPQCGAPLQNERECEYCGVRFVEDVLRVQNYGYTTRYSTNTTQAPGISQKIFVEIADAMIEKQKRELERAIFERVRGKCT